MNFLSKKLSRLGKSSDEYYVTFKPLSLSVSTFEEGTEFQLIFKRGNKRNVYKKMKASPSKHGGNLQTINFNENEEYSEKSGFFKEKDGSFQNKEARIKIVYYDPHDRETP